MKSLLRLLFLPLFASLFLSCKQREDHQTATVALPSSHSVSALAVPDESIKYSHMEPTSSISHRVPDEALHAHMVIKTADITLEVTQYDEVFAQVQKITADHDGFVVASTATSHEQKYSSGRITVRVPSTRFDETLQRVKKLASKIESEQIQGNDVAEEFYDVSARLENKRRAEKQFYEIFKMAKNVQEVLEVEGALTGVRQEIERLEGHKHYLADMVKLSTINICMHEPYPPAAPVVVPVKAGFLSKAAAGALKGVDTFGDMVGSIAYILIAGSPIFAGIFIVLFVLLKSLRLNRIHRKEIPAKFIAK